LGAVYLSSLRTQFVRDYLVLSAYNGGPGNVNRWLKLVGTSDPVLFTELIPNDENEQFVKKTLKYSLVYKFVLSRD
jgi:soluble lytic murein transglycosylase